MGSRFYLFTEPEKLDTQVAAQAFGPAAPDPLTPGNDRYRITDTHPLTGGSADAVAVCDGILCAQKDGPNTLSLILKPSQAPPFESPVVSYFIYKGIDVGSLLNSSGDAVLDDSVTDAPDFIKKIATEWKKQNPDLSGSRAALGLDRDANLSHDDVNQTKVFTDADPIDRLFTYPHKTVQLPTIAAGDVIGSFMGSAGFEIVLQRLGYAPKLALARQAENHISVPSLAADNGGTPWQADDAAFFAHWHAKEQVLAYMDPCAFFGAFVQAALYKTSAGNADKIKGSDIYQDVLKRFFNCNIAYLDIRNNYSYSYNLFGLYDDTIRFVSHSDANQTNDKNFRSGSWPILRLSVADVPGSRKKSLHRTKLRLPVGLSTAPAVLVSKGYVATLGPEQPKYRAPTIAADSTDPAFYQPIRLAFAATQDGAQDVFSCSYTRVNIYEKPHASQPAAGTLDVAGGNYLDGLFRLRDLRLDTNFAGNGLRFDIYPEEVLVDLDGHYGPTYSAAVGIIEDTNYAVLLAFPCYFLPNSSDTGRLQTAASWANGSAPAPTDFTLWLKSKFPSTDLTKATTNSGTPNALDVLIARAPQGADRAKLSGVGQLNDYCMIVIAKADHISLLSAIEADNHLNPSSPVFLTTSGTATRQDTTSSFTYTDSTLQATGYQQGSSASKISTFDKALNKQALQYADI